MSEPDFPVPTTWMIEIYHRNPGSDGVWFRVVEANTEKEAIRIAVALFVGDGLNEILIDKINYTELTLPKGGEDGER